MLPCGCFALVLSVKFELYIFMQLLLGCNALIFYIDRAGIFIYIVYYAGIFYIPCVLLLFISVCIVLFLFIL